MNSPELDVLIVGGGMVGASLALALKHTPLKIGLIEAHSIQHHHQPSYDDRGIALSQGSYRILAGLGIWSDIASLSSPIQHIHVSDRGRFGVTRLSAQQEQVSALGYVVTARELGQVLNRQLQQQVNLTTYCPASVTALSQQSDHVSVTLNDQRQLSTKLLVAADGRESTIRQLLGLSAWIQKYDQTAITANISTDKPHEGWAFERFTDSGPLALLPMSAQRNSLIWTVNSGEEAALLSLSETDFLQRLQQRFGYRAGRFIKVGQRHSHPLTLLQTDMPVQQRIVLIGNAAHSLHPIAGQGFNLGLRDAAVLAELIAQQQTDAGDSRLLHQYQQSRQQDQDRLVKATDQLVRLFSNQSVLLGHARGAGLALLDTLPKPKSWIAAQSMGTGLKQSRLARGLSL